MRSLRIKTILRPLVFALVTGGVLAIFPTVSSAQATPEATLTAFYKWYLHELVAEHYPEHTSPKVSAISSARLKKWFKTKAGREWDADYFIDAQDWDPKWETHIKATPAVIKGNNADLRIILGPEVKAVNSMSPHTLRIKMVKENGAWKIDHINGY
jgi:hypothetical protein